MPHDFMPGLAGVPAAKSAISDVDGEHGVLEYRGIRIEDLCRHSTFLETAYLLIFGQLPSGDELARFVDDITRHRRIKFRIVDLIKEKNVLAVKADTTAEDMPATRDLDQRYQGAGAIPLTILLVPGKPPARLLGTYPPSELSALLEALPAPESQEQPPVPKPMSFTSLDAKLQTLTGPAPESSDKASR